MKKKTGRKMKLPNQFGTISKLPGNRRKPYMARTGPTGFNEIGDPVRKIVGYYETWEDAYAALIEHNRNPMELEAKKVTLADLHEIYLHRKHLDMDEIPAYTRSRLKFYVEASAPLQRMPFIQIRGIHMETILDGLLDDYAYGTLTHLKTYWHDIYKIAISCAYVDKDYSELACINKKNDTEHCEAITEREINILWDNVDRVENVDVALVMIYSGFRAAAYQELDVDLANNWFKGGVKTQAGKDRIVPIHHRIRPLVERLVGSQRLFGSKYAALRARVLEAFSKCGIGPYSLHDTRSTMATRLDRARVDGILIKRLMGHAIKDVTYSVYVKEDIDQLREAVEKLP